MNSLSKSVLLALSALALAGITNAKAQTTIADWDFDLIGSQAAGYNTATPTTGSGFATQLGMTNSYTYTDGEGPGSSAACDVTAAAGASTGSGSLGWRIRGNSNTANAGAGNANGWNSAAPIGTQGAEFEVNTSLYSSISLTVDVNDTTQGERNLAILYTTDDTAATPTWQVATITSAGSLGTLATNSSSANTIMGNYVKLSASGTGWDNQVTATFSGISQDANFAFELVNASTGADDVNAAGTALNNNSGNWRFDNVIISGVVAAPEPSTYALLIAGFLALVGVQKLRRNSTRA